MESASKHARNGAKDAMKNKILELEKSLFKYACMSDYEWLDNVISADYQELGKSGILFNKEQVILALLECREDRDIDIYNFECFSMSDRTYLVHYITKSGDDLFYRTSIWIMENNLKLLFHQASLLKYKLELIKC